MANAVKTAQSVRHSHPLTWWVFFILLVSGVGFVIGTASELPPTVASHFDSSGQPNAYMSRSGYILFMLCLVLGLPLAAVGGLTRIYSRSTQMKLPNRDYWLAPQRLDQTRAFLIAHGIWFGSLLVALTCCVHWLELLANRTQPAHLSGQMFAVLMIAFLLSTLAWTGALMLALRRPAGE